MSKNEAVGVLVGADASQEWLLAWFYSHFREFNPECPIAFADFGMSPEGQCWCRERGALFTVPELSSGAMDQPGSFFEGEFWAQWGAGTSGCMPMASIYFRKPLALALSPFDKTLWLDLDCEVRGDLEALMSLPLPSDGLGATFCGSGCFIKNLGSGEIIPVPKYSTGVLLAEKNSALLTEWVELVKGKISFYTDEECLGFLVERKQRPMTLIPCEYNWPAANWGENSMAFIYHWMGKEGKQRIKALVDGFKLDRSLG